MDKDEQLTDHDIIALVNWGDNEDDDTEARQNGQNESY